jgi:hypothetical protein
MGGEDRFGDVLCGMIFPGFVILTGVGQDIYNTYMTDIQIVRTAIYEWFADLDSPIDSSEMGIRFWGKVNPQFNCDGCLIWNGALSSGGYGNFTIKGVLVLAHRVAVRLGNSEYGYSPRAIPKGMTVDHDKSLGCPPNKLCEYPGHLTVVTRSANSGRNSDMLKFT